MEIALTVPTVAKDLFRGLLTVIFVSVCVFSILIVVVVVVANNLTKTREKAEWCAEYMPKASHGECTAEAGW